MCTTNKAFSKVGESLRSIADGISLVEHTVIITNCPSKGALAGSDAPFDGHQHSDETRVGQMAVSTMIHTLFTVPYRPLSIRAGALICHFVVPH